MAAPNTTANYTAQFDAAMVFEREGYATGNVTQDPFYVVDRAWVDASPGTLFRSEPLNPANYTLPPGVAGSRILYQSENFNGGKVPASGVVLFPYLPKKVKGSDGKDEIPVVIWAHGTASLWANGAPSHLRNLWQHFMVPFPLALHGYIVVLPDFAGLGASVDGNGKHIVHEYLANQASAKDMEYAYKAARTGFDGVLGSRFVAIGHSQGGGSAWSFAERMASHPAEGYLGAVPISPVTKLLDYPELMKPVLAAGALPGMENIYPGFKKESILTEDGVARCDADAEVGGNVYISKVLLFGADLFKPGWEQDEHMQRFQNETHTGGRPIGGPLLVLQGETDPLIAYNVTDQAIADTVKVNPDQEIKYVKFANTSHVPTNFVSQRIWLDWIEEKFAGVEPKKGLCEEKYEPLRPVEEYPPDINWYIALGTEPYHTP